MTRQCCRLASNLLLWLTMTLTPLLAINVYGLTVEDYGSYTLDVGNHYYDELVLGENSTFYVKGETYIFVKRLFSEDGAKIEYIAGTGRQDNNKWLRFEVRDASAMRGTLTLIGTGANGNNGEHGKRGEDGRDVHSHHMKSKSANPGSPGQDGETGEAGENGMHIEVNIAYLPLQSYVRIISNGGDAGNGGNGGKGGKGGDGKYDRNAQDGGKGGNGSDGGKGGNGGDIRTSLLYSGNPSQEQLEELKELAKNNIVAKPGQGGEGGKGGYGGAGGKGGSNPWYHNGTSNAGANGNDGNDGSKGNPGKVPPPNVGHIPPYPPPGINAVHGNILDNQGNPILGAKVEISGYAPVITDENGFWQINDLPSGDYLITASKSGYEFSPAGFSLNDENPVVAINIPIIGKVKPATAVDHINKCISKFPDYFGTPISLVYDCRDNHYCQNTTGGSLVKLTGISVHKSERDFLFYE